jgi:hypothetical protein
MRLSKTATWLSGIAIMFAIYGLNRGLFLLKAKHTWGDVLATDYYYYRKSNTSSNSYQVQFFYDNRYYVFWSSQFSGRTYNNQVPVVFNPDNPNNAYEYSFGGFWLWGIIIIAIAFVPWSAASLSFIGSDERLVIGWKKFRVEKNIDWSELQNPGK